MDFNLKITLFGLLSLCFFWQASGYKILGLFPYHGRSHVIMFESIMKELARRGHTVHVISHYPLEKPLENYTEFSLRGSMPLRLSIMDVQAVSESLRRDYFHIKSMRLLHEHIARHEKVMMTDTMQALMRSKESYDLIITESFSVDMTLGFVHKFKTPFIFLSSGPLMPWTAQFVGSPQNPSYIPSTFSRYSNRMSFIERLYNTLCLKTILLYWHWFFAPESERLMKKHFGEDTPPLLETAKNVSLVFTNSHFSLMGPRPLVPATVDVAGVHVENAKQLPHDIEKFIDESPEGVLYFCLGSVVRAETFPEEKREAFLAAFSKLKQRVLWKFEGENMPGKSSDILIKKWMPQRDILAHPKVKLFITHGGLLGLIEAVHEGKPVLGIPLFGDQGVNIRGLEDAGMAVYLDYKSISNDTVLQRIQEALKPQYAERAKQISRVYHDRPMKPLDTVVYWVEYVIRHKDYRGLRSIAVDMPYYQYLLIDVIIVIVATLLLVILSFLYSVKKLMQMLKRKEPGKDKPKPKNE